MHQIAAPRPSPGRSALPAALLAAAIVYLCCLVWLPRLERRLDPLTGDEPFYVMTAISLIEDRDLDEQNNYDRRDFHRFYPAFGPTPDGWPSYPNPLPPHRSQTKRAGLYSKHGLGMALLIALPYELGGRTLTLIVLAGIAAALTANMTLFGARYIPSTWLAAIVAIALSLTNPLFSFSLLIFPEMMAALCILYATRRLLEPRNHTWQWVAIGACAASLPWLHYRLAPISVVLAVAAIVRFRRSWTRRAVAAAATPPIVSAIVLFWWCQRLYGRPLPPTSDHAGFSGMVGTLNGLAGTFLDQQWGAFIHNPLLLLAAASFVPFALAHRRDALVIGAIVVPYLFLVASYRVWWGEWNPPARYLTDVVPLAAAPLAWWLSHVRRPWRWSMLGAFAAPAAAVMATFLADPQRMYNHPDGTSRLLETWKGWTSLDLTGALPSYVFYSASPAAVRLVFALLGLAWLGTLATVAYGLTSQRAASETSR
ncbi:MAG: hypothetical protein QOF73_2143 [Thermomicrobiales bacterium]|nr:hypothetical protein [Thermomicrobiales bacterium]